MIIYNPRQASLASYLSLGIVNEFTKQPDHCHPSQTDRQTDRQASATVATHIVKQVLADCPVVSSCRLAPFISANQAKPSPSPKVPRMKPSPTEQNGEQAQD